MPEKSKSEFISIHRSVRSVIGSFALAILVGVLGIALSEHDLFHASFELFGSNIRLPFFLLLFLVLAIRPIVLLKDSQYAISPHHIQTVRGALSLKRREVRVPFEELRGVRVEQSLFDRVLGVGTVVAWCHSASTPEIQLKGILGPQKFANLISDRIDQALIEKKHNNSN